MFFAKTTTCHRLPGSFRAALAVAAIIAVCGVRADIAVAQGVQRIAAVVNEDVISAYDLEQRVRLVMVTGRVPDTEENRRRLRAQVLRNMIDEQLQMQEAKRLNIRTSDEEVEKLLAKLNEQNNLAPGTLEAALQKANVDVNVLRAKLRADENWAKVIRGSLQQQVFISDEEVEEELQRLRAAQHLPRNRVAEIFLPVDNPDNERQILDTATRLMQQIRNGADFRALAREFSQSASAAVGGDLGWITKGQLDPALDATIANMQKGQVAGPTRTLSGYYILLLIDRALPSGGGAATLDYTQIVLPLPADAGPDEVGKEEAVAQQIRADIQSCDDMRSAAATSGGAASGDRTNVSAKDLPPAIREAVAKLKVGETTAPIRVAEGLFMATLCGRSGGGGNLPTAEEVRNRIGNDRFNLLVQRYMRDLRQTAFVDIRG